jgi:hypothetical protein
VHRGLDDVLQYRHVRPQVEMLEHHGQSGAQARQLLGVNGVQFAIGPGTHVQFFITHINPALMRLLQQVDAAQEGAFS